jgi:hypothetical protein
MSNRGRGRRSCARGRRSAPRGHVGDEFLTFSVALGATQNINLGSVSTRPKGCNFRPLVITASATTAYIPATSNDSLAGYFTPAALDVQLCSGTDGGNVVATSRPQVLGSNPRNVTARYPRSGDWYPYDKPSTTIIARLNAVCLGAPGVSVKGYVRGTLHIRYQYSFEVLTAVCPTHLCDTDFTPM